MQTNYLDEIDENMLQKETNKFLWEISQDSRIWIDIDSCLESSTTWQAGEIC